ncbi:hypothetical protein CkaCkLH20_12526 [Colletotrichum karsti]|uniref:Uncharacterized protein n=1 Tax=Colletotrichum karsti TaxID=1095194 RepID=A0A9P6LEF9_9PEZI|nr:uncharacterized protein CkaCkLH20_12526 [Colletotrichum karsti]KAF9870046.1 hypothetical protein CkaCkLH20_12526 [Colletotrichum karsti]
MEASIADLKATVEMLVAGGRPEFRRTLVVARQEKNASERNATGGSVIDDNDGVGSVGSGGTVITIRPPGNEDVEPADRHVSSSLAEVVRKVGSQLSGGFQRTFKTKADVVSLGKLDVKTARDLLADWAATTGRPATVPPAYLTQCKLLLNFEEVTMRDAMLYAEITLYLILHDKFSQRSYLGADGDCEELTAWRSRWSYLFDLPAASTLRISHSIAWLILARRTLEHDQASSDQDSLSSSPRLQPADAVRQEPHLPSQNPELWNLAHARVCNLATEVVRAFVEMPSARAEELPEFHRLCVAYAMLIISKYEQKPPYGGAEGGVTRSMEVLQLLKAAQKQNAVWSASSPSAIQFGLERALKKVTARVEGAAHGSAANPRAGPTPATAMTIDDRAPHRIGMLSPNNVQGAAAGAPMSWGHHHPDVMGQQQHDHPSSFTNATLLPEFEESFEMIGNFFNGGHLSLGDPSLMDMFQK